MGFEKVHVKGCRYNEHIRRPVIHITKQGRGIFNAKACDEFELNQYQLMEPFANVDLKHIGLRPTHTYTSTALRISFYGQIRGRQIGISLVGCINSAGAKVSEIGLNHFELTKNEDGLLVIDLNKPLDQEKK